MKTRPRLRTADVAAVFGSYAALARALQIKSPSTFGKSWKPYVPKKQELILRYELRPTIDEEIKKQRRSR